MMDDIRIRGKRHGLKRDTSYERDRKGGNVMDGMKEMRLKTTLNV